MSDTPYDEQEIVRKSLAEMKAGRAFGYLITDLEAAFALVKPPGNWKLPIDAIVPAGTDTGLLDAAVCFYTGGGIEAVEVPGGLRILAGGYYANIGA